MLINKQNNHQAMVLLTCKWKIMANRRWGKEAVDNKKMLRVSWQSTILKS